MVQRLGDYDGMSKNDWKNLRCGYGEGWSVKMDRQNKKYSCTRKNGRRNPRPAGKFCVAREGYFTKYKAL